MATHVQVDAKPDAKLEAARAQWAARFTAAGVPIADFQEVTHSISRWAEWCQAWCERAAVHEEIGREARTLGFLHVESGPLVRSSYHAEEQHAAVKVEIHEIQGEDGRPCRHDHMQAPAGDDEAQRAANHTQQGALGEQLPDDPPPCGAQGALDAQLDVPIDARARSIQATFVQPISSTTSAGPNIITNPPVVRL